MHIAVLPSVFLLNFLDTLLLHVPVGDGPVSDGPVAIHSSSLLTRWPLNLCFLAGWCCSFNIYSTEILISLFQILVWLKVVHTEPGTCLLARGMQGGSSIKPCSLVSFRVDLQRNLLPLWLSSLQLRSLWHCWISSSNKRDVQEPVLGQWSFSSTM